MQRGARARHDGRRVTCDELSQTIDSAAFVQHLHNHGNRGKVLDAGTGIRDIQRRGGAEVKQNCRYCAACLDDLSRGRCVLAIVV